MENEIKGTGMLESLKVLYVEDDNLSRRELSKFLKRRVGILFTAENGRQALDIYRKTDPDLIIVDLMLPELNGIELAQAIRKSDSETPIIIISALSDSETILRTVEMDIVKYIVKPVDTEELQKTMKQLAGKIFRKRADKFCSGDYVVDKSSKVLLEKEFKSRFAAFLKQQTGKGPEHILTVLRYDSLEIQLSGILTPMEKSVLNGGNNSKLVEYWRRIFYEQNRQKMADMVREIFGREMDSVENKCVPQDGYETIRITFG